MDRDAILAELKRCRDDAMKPDAGHREVIALEDALRHWSEYQRVLKLVAKSNAIVYKATASDEIRGILSRA